MTTIKFSPGGQLQLGTYNIYQTLSTDSLTLNKDDSVSLALIACHDDNDHYATIDLRRARGTSTSPDILNEGSVLGGINFTGYTVSNWTSLSAQFVAVASNIEDDSCESRLEYRSLYQGNIEPRIIVQPRGDTSFSVGGALVFSITETGVSSAGTITAQGNVVADNIVERTANAGVRINNQVTVYDTGAIYAASLSNVNGTFEYISNAGGGVGGHSFYIDGFIRLRVSETTMTAHGVDISTTTGRLYIGSDVEATSTDEAAINTPGGISCHKNILCGGTLRCNALSARSGNLTLSGALITDSVVVSAPLAVTGTATVTGALDVNGGILWPSTRTLSNYNYASYTVSWVLTGASGNVTSASATLRAIRFDSWVIVHFAGGPIVTNGNAFDITGWLDSTPAIDAEFRPDVGSGGVSCLLYLVLAGTPTPMRWHILPSGIFRIQMSSGTQVTIPTGQTIQLIPMSLSFTKAFA